MDNISYMIFVVPTNHSKFLFSHIFSLGINGYICFDNNGLNMMNSTCLDKNLENIQEDDVM